MVATKLSKRALSRLRNLNIIFPQKTAFHAPIKADNCKAAEVGPWPDAMRLGARKLLNLRKRHPFGALVRFTLMMWQVHSKASLCNQQNLAQRFAA